jgi:short-subunit dehydrogenase
LKSNIPFQKFIFDRVFFIILAFENNDMKNIIITGTSRGIGYELALQFAKAGHHVLAISRKTPQVLIENENITCLAVDLGKEDEKKSISIAKT